VILTGDPVRLLVVDEEESRGLDWPDVAVPRPHSSVHDDLAEGAAPSGNASHPEPPPAGKWFDGGERRAGRFVSAANA
jgi:hypothetical protein